MKQATATLIGMPNVKYRLLRDELQQAIEEIPFSIVLQEVNEIDQILNYSVASIPAVIFNDQVLFENGHIPNKSELIESIFQQSSKPLLMKKILIPIDFSDTSLSAFLFAGELALKFGAGIDVVHIYNGSLNTNKGLTFELMQTKEESILNRLHKFINIAPSEGGKDIAINTECKTFLSYNTSAKLCKLSKEYDLVIMGMTGKHLIEKKLIGSIASYVAQNATCPVLLVPREYKFTGLNNIVYAQNWESINDFALQSVVELGKAFYAALHFVHVNETLDIRDFTTLEQESLIELLEENAPETDYQIVNVNSESPKQGIEDYAHKHKADLIVLVNRQHSFTDNLFKRSLTKEMALHSDVPLLIYHARKNLRY